ncbi:MAG: hypothetical protein CBD48_00540 [Cyanobacteria bacterium TMED188]|nr:MAG: hypothetical protein CBD48_00540 [Cyanobacteria bacterium TMED188]
MLQQLRWRLLLALEPIRVIRLQFHVVLESIGAGLQPRQQQCNQDCINGRWPGVPAGADGGALGLEVDQVATALVELEQSALQIKTHAPMQHQSLIRTAEQQQIRRR